MTYVRRISDDATGQLPKLAPPRLMPLCAQCLRQPGGQTDTGRIIETRALSAAVAKRNLEFAINNALMLVQPATVARWHREGFRGCWRRRARRRPGRPPIDSELRDIIRRMSAENFLWGAPRIHGELLKLGFTISERTVSRYLPRRLQAPSQTWRTFLANHFGALVRSSTVTSFDILSDEDVVGDGYVFSLGCTPSSGDALCASKDPPLLSRVATAPTRTGVRVLHCPGPSDTDMIHSPELDHRPFWMISA
jgi:hypothetical protein